jgi:hypothetical protein
MDKLSPEAAKLVREAVNDNLQEKYEVLLRIGRAVGVVSLAALLSFLWSFYSFVKDAAKDAAEKAAKGEVVREISGDASFQKRVAALAVFPKGSIVIFDPREKEGVAAPSVCPEGWVAHEASMGRFVVGAGQRTDSKSDEGYWVQEGTKERIRLSSYIVGQTGGEEKHLLTTGEMPSHSHSVYRHAAGEDFKTITGGTPPPGYTYGAGSADANTGGTWVKDTGRTRSEGASQAHNIVPPFVALHFCRKS